MHVIYITNRKYKNKFTNWLIIKCTKISITNCDLKKDKKGSILIRHNEIIQHIGFSLYFNDKKIF